MSANNYVPRVARDSIADAVTLDIVVLNKQKELARLDTLYQSYETIMRLDRDHYDDVNRLLKKVAKKVSQLLEETTPQYVLAKTDGEIGSGRYAMSREMFFEQRDVDPAFASSFADIKKQQQVTMGIAVQLAEIFGREIRIIDVLADGDCGRYVKALFTGQPMNDDPIFQNAPWGFKGASGKNWLQEDQLVTPLYDLVIVSIETEEGVLKPRYNSRKRVIVSTPFNGPDFNVNRPKAVMVNMNNTHWFLVAPPRLLPEHNTPLFDAQGNSNLLWPGGANSDYHAMMRHGENDIAFNAVDNDPKHMFQTQGPFCNFT